MMALLQSRIYTADGGHSFPNIYDRFAKYLSKESQILVEGRISIKEDEQPRF